LFLLSWRNSPVGRKNFEVPTPSSGLYFFCLAKRKQLPFRFEAGAHGDISAGASFGGTPNQAGKDLRSNDDPSIVEPIELSTSAA
jgi:hypothetical protein